MALMHPWGLKGLICVSGLLSLILLWCLLVMTADVQKRWQLSSRFPSFRGKLPRRSRFGAIESAQRGVDFPSLFTSSHTHPRCEPGQLLLILVTSAPGNSEPRQVIRRTWAAHEGQTANQWQSVFLVGQSADIGVAHGIQREQQEFGDILIGNYQDTYRNLTLKVMHGFKWVAERCRPSYILKTDDDCFVNTDRLPEFLLEHNTIKTGLYAGSLFSREKRQVIREPSSKWYVSRQDYRPDEYPPYASGIGYILSLDAVERILWAAEHVHPIPVEDAYVGILAEKAGIRVKSSARFAKHNVRWRVCNYRYLMVIHHLSPQEQEVAKGNMLQARSACHESLEVTRWK
nr:beta-1,3-galactosyltransferase 5-like [Chrysemys picta bellii]XP_023963667.1 beta-1,3-galactosyltransferase 5-like [Chrysemys picta bellii]XP_042697345.1 beta-1,3-galactosyltransferase 5-like [Chrysemys picta bellii]